MKYKVSDLLNIIYEEVDFILSENTRSQLLVCNHAEWDFNKLNNNSPNAQTRINAYKSALGGTGSSFRQLLDNEPALTQIFATYEEIYKNLWDAATKLNSIQSNRGSFNSSSDVVKDKCQALQAAISDMRKFDTMLSDLRQQLTHLNPNLQTFSLAELFYHEAFDNGDSVLVQAAGDITALLGEAPQREKFKIDDVKNVDFTKIAKIFPVFAYIDNSVGEALRKESNRVGCMRVWREISEQNIAAMAGIGAGFGGTAFGVYKAHKWANNQELRKWGFKADNRYGISMFDKFKSNAKFRGARTIIGTGLYAAVVAVLLQSPNVKAEANLKAKNALKELNDQILKSNNPEEIARLKADRANITGETPRGKNLGLDLGEGALIGATCAFALYQTALLGATFVKMYIQGGDMSFMQGAAAGRSLSDRVTDLWAGFRRDLGDADDAEFALGWITLANPSGIRLTTQSGDSVFNLFIRQADDIDVVDNAVISDFLDTAASLGEKKLADQLAANGLTREGAELVANRIINSQSEVLANLQKFARTMVRDKDKRMIPFIALIRELSDSAYRSGKIKLKDNQILKILEDATQRINQLADDIDASVKDMRTAAGILDNQGRTARQFIDRLDQGNVSGLSGNARLEIVGEAADIDFMLREVSNLSYIYSGYARGAGAMRLTAGGILKVPGQAASDASLSVLKYGRIQRLISAQLDDLANPTGIFQGLNLTTKGPAAIKDMTTALEKLQKNLTIARKNHSKMFNFMRISDDKVTEMDDFFLKVTNTETSITLKTAGSTPNPTLIVKPMTPDAHIDAFVDFAQNNAQLSVKQANKLRIDIKRLRDTKRFVFEATGRDPAGTQPIEFLGRMNTPDTAILKESKTVKKINLNILRS